MVSASEGEEDIDSSQRQSSQLSTLSKIESRVAAVNLVNVFDWNFNTLEVDNNVTLCEITLKLFDKVCNIADIGLDHRIFSEYISEASLKYRDLPFHNFRHAVAVCHITVKFFDILTITNTINALEKFAILFSAIVHDIAHPGNTNQFEINSKSELSLIYNDNAVLENHHCSTAFLLMGKQHLDFTKSLSRDDYNKFRQMTIACIMATDMSQHKKIIANLAEISAKAKKGIEWDLKDRGKVYCACALYLYHFLFWFVFKIFFTFQITYYCLVSV